MFNISDEDLMDKNKPIVLDGIGGCGKSTMTVNELRRLGSNFIMLSFSNALKKAALKKFNCPVDTICGALFVNAPYPRYCEKDITEYDTVIIDEALLDGSECIEWAINHIGKTNIIILTDSRQMLNAESGDSALKAFHRLIERDDTIYVQIDKTKRARDDETFATYDKLYALESEKLFTVKEAAKILGCPIVSIDDINYSSDATFICHSNVIEHDAYVRYDISNRRDIDLIPKNHISRKNNVNYDKYPICDQITANDNAIASYLQAANIATPTRFQGKEVDKDDSCYFIVESGSICSGREIYTVGTRCQSISSLKIVIVEPKVYKDPKTIANSPIVSPKHLDIKCDDKKLKMVSTAAIRNIIKEKGKKNECYYDDYITSGDHIVYSSVNLAVLKKIAKLEGQEMTFVKNKYYKRSIRSMARKDATLYFDFMPRVYEIINMDVKPPRIINPENSHKKKFNMLCDIYSAFPTVLNYADMPKAGKLYEEYGSGLMNFYIYNGTKVTKGSLITEELANMLGDSEYVFSTDKQKGCSIGFYTYKKCKETKEAKKKINEDFLWGILEKNYYQWTRYVKNGDTGAGYVKNENNNLELIACALWSKLCCIMLSAIQSINADDFYVITDGLYYNGDVMPTLPDWCDYRIEAIDWDTNKDKVEKYENILFKTYNDLLSEQDVTNMKRREKRSVLNEDELEEVRSKERERKARSIEKKGRKKRSEMTEEELEDIRSKERERKKLNRAVKKNGGFAL